MPAKLKAMRQYLAAEERTFVNNVVVSLPSETRFRKEGKEVGAQEIINAGNYEVCIPRAFNAIGLIDGQHRLFSYHEGEDSLEQIIATKRTKQQLLVTGVLFPSDYSEQQRQQFEAQLFLEINDKQTRTKGDLRQAIQVIVKPFSSIAIAKSVLGCLARSGPLEGLLVDHYFDEGKIKTTSIVSYALKPLVAPDPTLEGSLYRLWLKNNEPLSQDHELRNRYVKFCAQEVNNLLIALKIKLPDSLWTPDQKVSKALSVIGINGLLFCLQLLVKHDKTGGLKYYKARLDLSSIDYATKEFQYRGSHWRTLGQQLAEGFGVEAKLGTRQAIAE